MTDERNSGAELVAEHLRDCTKATAAIVMHEGSADEVIASLVAAGWTLEEGQEVVAGKRIRTMIPPPEVAEQLRSGGAS